MRNYLFKCIQLRSFLLNEVAKYKKIATKRIFLVPLHIEAYSGNKAKEKKRNEEEHKYKVSDVMGC